MSTLDDRTFRKTIAEVLRDLASKVEAGQISAIEYAASPVADCPPGFAIHAITFQVRKS